VENVYTVPKDTEITNQVILDAINYNEKYKARYNLLEDYYIGKHAIVRRNKSIGLMNNKVVVNHAKYITDTNIGYLLGNPVDYQVSEEYEDVVQPILDAYSRQTINDLDSEIAKDVSVFGSQYEYIYANEAAEPKSCEIDDRNAIIVYDDTVEHNKLFGIIYRPVKNGRKLTHYEVTVCTDRELRQYKVNTAALVPVAPPQPHKFGLVPLIQYKNNPELMGDYEPVISLIDAYNTLQSDRINDKEQLVDAILCLYGMDFDEEQADMLKDSRMLANIPTDGKVEYLVKTLHETDVDVLRKNIEADIHKISMTPNMSDENFVGNSSGVAIRYKLLAFEQNIKNKERYMEKGLMERFSIYNNYLVAVSKMTKIIPIEDVDAVFKRNLPSNDLEISQMINNLSDYVDAETLVSQLSFIKDASEIVELKKKEDEEKEPEESYNNQFSVNQVPDVNTAEPITEPEE
jgi:SPP1 family phage portal protein